ncbi:hypothetical protein COCMIDRAFT_21725 [Bipolaris oryzae ATCC 44560]|uniref:Uncharacterized protein n=1 Tax=Bipolaris oryzae ATCC 44560 TaxID=930090 RepID=W7A3W0_COCMI|nr:uncharacterized protein COCMIDRAFT_21725 [Bipolaris oryzae ATCC 44560]EUC50706.1 hypothetical protein COCMIDRAFT_21725 [Bipolaris oryzae ATCC 44560]
MDVPEQHLRSSWLCISYVREASLLRDSLGARGLCQRLTGIRIKCVLDWASVEGEGKQGRRTGRGKAHIEGWNILKRYGYGEAESVTLDCQDVGAGSMGGRWTGSGQGFRLLAARKLASPLRTHTRLWIFRNARAAGQQSRGHERRLCCWPGVRPGLRRRLGGGCGNSRGEMSNSEQNECLWRAMQVERHGPGEEKGDDGKMTH